jgi:hypothetical protein
VFSSILGREIGIRLPVYLRFKPKVESSYRRNRTSRLHAFAYGVLRRFDLHYMWLLASANEGASGGGRKI